MRLLLSIQPTIPLFGAALCPGFLFGMGIA
jgi:hypothetical protein